MVFSFEHMECDQVFIKWFKTKFKPQKLFTCLTKWQKSLPWNALYLENHDQPRSVSRFGSKTHPLESGKLLATLLLSLRGTPFIYQGQEIGMTNFDFTRLRQLNDVESLNVTGSWPGSTYLRGSAGGLFPPPAGTTPGPPSSGRAATEQASPPAGHGLALTTTART